MDKKDEKIQIKKDDSQKIGIHTVKDDLSMALSGNSARTVKKAIDDARAEENVTRNRNLRSNKNKFLFGLSIILLVVATILIVLGLGKRNFGATVEPQIIYPGLITYDDTKIIGEFEPKPSLMKKKWLDANVDLKMGLTRLRFQNIDPVKTKDLVEAFGWEMSAILKGNLGPVIDFGFYKNENDNVSPFILIQTLGTDQAFAGFSTWEDKILFDLGEVFNFNDLAALDPIYQKQFESILIQSHDGRVLYDDNGQIVLIMIFLDESHAVVTNSKEAVTEILKRVILNK